MKLAFQRSSGDEVEIANVKDKDEAMDQIKKFLDWHHYKSYYTRMWHDDEQSCTWFDVGSHTEFFKLYDE